MSRLETFFRSESHSSDNRPMNGAVLVKSRLASTPDKAISHSRRRVLPTDTPSRQDGTAPAEEHPPVAPSARQLQCMSCFDAFAVYAAEIVLIA
jgi:hypothetical protein